MKSLQRLTATAFPALWRVRNCQSYYCYYYYYVSSAYVMHSCIIGLIVAIRWPASFTSEALISQTLHSTCSWLCTNWHVLANVQLTSSTPDWRWLTSNEHRDDREDFLSVGVGWDIAEADTSEAGAGEIQSWDVRRHAGQTLKHRLVHYWRVELVRQLVQPTCHSSRHLTLHTDDMQCTQCHVSHTK